jgi:hypothetical protein
MTMEEGEDWSPGSMSKVSDVDVEGMEDWETLMDTFVSERSTSIVAQHDDNHSVMAAALESIS